MGAQHVIFLARPPYNNIPCCRKFSLHFMDRTRLLSFLILQQYHLEVMEAFDSFSGAYVPWSQCLAHAQFCTLRRVPRGPPIGCKVRISQQREKCSVYSIYWCLVRMSEFKIQKCYRSAVPTLWCICEHPPHRAAVRPSNAHQTDDMPASLTTREIHLSYSQQRLVIDQFGPIKSILQRDPQ